MEAFYLLSEYDNVRIATKMAKYLEIYIRSDEQWQK